MADESSDHLEACKSVVTKWLVANNLFDDREEAYKRMSSMVTHFVQAHPTKTNVDALDMALAGSEDCLVALVARAILFEN